MPLSEHYSLFMRSQEDRDEQTIRIVVWVFAVAVFLTLVYLVATGIDGLL